MPDSVVKDPSDFRSIRKRLSHARLVQPSHCDRGERESDSLAIGSSSRARYRTVWQRTEFPEAAQRVGGADRNRTDDLRLARAALSQLSYSPEVGPSGGPR